MVQAFLSNMNLYSWDFNFVTLSDYAILSIILFVIVFIRYLIFSGVAHFLLKKLFNKRLLYVEKTTKKQLYNEIKWSAITSLIFSLSGVGMMKLWQLGQIPIYTELTKFPLWYIPISIFLILFLHETYYYWLHRWMHKPKIYRAIHKTHHDSLHTSALTAFSFHPVESVLQAIIIPLLIWIIPLHVFALIFILMVMTVSATINHLGFEIYPKWWNNNFFSKWIIGATHHDQHHTKFLYNYGLYFTVWDKWMKTESPDFDERYKEVTS